MSILLAAKKAKNGREKHCIRSIVTPAETTSSSADISPIQCSAKKNKIIDDAVKKIVPTATVIIKAFFTLEYFFAP